MSGSPFALAGAQWGGAISGVTGEGTQELLERIYPHLREIDRQEMEKAVNFLRLKKLSVFRPGGR